MSPTLGRRVARPRCRILRDSQQYDIPRLTSHPGSQAKLAPAPRCATRCRRGGNRSAAPVRSLEARLGLMGGAFRSSCSRRRRNMLSNRALRRAPRRPSQRLHHMDRHRHSRVPSPTHQLGAPRRQCPERRKRPKGKTASGHLQPEARLPAFRGLLGSEIGSTASRRAAKDNGRGPGTEDLVDSAVWPRCSRHHEQAAQLTKVRVIAAGTLCVANPFPAHSPEPMPAALGLAMASGRRYKRRRFTNSYGS